MLEKEIKYFDAHLSEWLTCQEGKFVVIKDEETIGFYNTFNEALSVGAKMFGMTSFLVRHITANPEEINIPAYVLGVLHANPTRSIS